MTTIHLGDCQTDCETCTNKYHSGFNNIDCDVCGQFIESAPLCNNCGQYETHANDYDCPAYNDEFLFSGVVAQLARDGIVSEVMHTGGGNATLYVGNPNAKGFYDVVCGAGVFDNENSFGFASQFWIGRDDDERQGQGFYYKGENDVKKIAHAIFEYFMFDKEQK